MDITQTQITIIRFSPKPELIEHVNVALLVTRCYMSGERDTRLVYDPKFPLLTCAVPEFNPELMRVHLESLSSQFEGDDSDDFIATLYPQFVIGDRVIVGNDAVDVVQYLLGR